MHHKYFIYPEAIEKIESSGLAQRVKVLKDKYELPDMKHVMKSELNGMTNEMKENGYFKTLPESFKAEFYSSLEKLFKNPENFNWIVDKNGEEIKGDVDLENVILMMGWNSYFVLKPDEIWDYEKFGFSSLIEFTGTFGAYVNNEQRISLRDGYTWESEVNGVKFKNKVSGSIHADLRIFRTDITPWKTKDPLGNEVLYRPVLRDDSTGVYGYHSVEGGLLASIMKYIEQNNIKSEMLENKGKKLSEWVKGISPSGFATCTEHLFPNHTNPSHFFVSYDLPILNINNKENRSIDGVFMECGGYYGIYVGPEKELIFSRLDKEGKPKNISCSFSSEEADHLIKGLFYQSTKSLGRTSLGQLVDIVNYRFSEQFDIDQSEFGKM